MTTTQEQQHHEQPIDAFFTPPQGNNMYLSLGNIVANPRAGLLFINRETGAPRRYRHFWFRTTDLWFGPTSFRAEIAQSLFSDMLASHGA